MTIRLRCAECRRKLKVVDEALGKIVQCPACGARFIGRIESSSPPVNETTPAAQPQAIAREPVAVEAASNESPKLDALFAEMGTPSPLTMEESGIAREVSLPPPPPAVPDLAPPSPLNLELDEPPLEVEAAEALEPEVVEEEEVPVIEEAIEEEPPLLDATEEELTSLDTPEPDVEELDSIDVVDEEEALPPTLTEKEHEAAEADADEAEIAEEAEPEEAEEKQPKKKKKRGLLCGCLSAIGLVMLLGCGGLGFFGYRFYSGSISDGDWKPLTVPEGRCSVSMPGQAIPTVETPKPGIELHKYTVAKPLAWSEFIVVYYDVSPDLMRVLPLEKQVEEEAANLAGRLQGTITTKQAVMQGTHRGQEARLDLPHGRKAIIRFFQSPQDGKVRVYELVAVAPNLQTNSGPGSKFFSSFVIIQMPPGGAGGLPVPGFPPQPIPPGR